MSQAHPLYVYFKPIWEKLVHCYEGTGGFQDGTYLVAHPREWLDFTADNPNKPTKKLKARWALARYENVAATILDQKRTALFRGEVTRTIGGEARSDQDHPLWDFWDDVDGEGTSIDDWMAEAFTPAALFGFVYHLMDKPATSGAQTQADEPSPYLRLYAPLDVPDWLLSDRGGLIAVRLLESVERQTLDDPQFSTLRFRERLITDEEWELREDGKKKDGGTHGFGRLPVIVQYAKRRGLTPLIGQSVLHDPKLYIDLYNLTSELRELLRLQTFSILNVPLGSGETGTDIEKAKTMMGDTTGAENVLFTPEAAQFIQADTANVEAYQEERRQLLRTIFRLAAVPWESDSKDAEAEGSLQLKREDMNQVLAGYADECEKTEYALCELWYRAMYGDSWERKYEQDEPTIRYPDTFDVTPFAEILEQAQAALSLEMGDTFMKELRRRLVSKFLPDATPAVIEAIEQELEQTKVQSPAKQKLEEMAMRFGGKPPAKAPEGAAA